MSNLKRYQNENVFLAARRRIRYLFDNFEKVYVSFSGGKDSTVLLHLVLWEAIIRKRKVGVLLIDLEAQYKLTAEHALKCFEMYVDHIDLHWVCLPLLMRNAVSNYEPRWCCWDPDAKDMWVRPLPEYPGVRSDPAEYPFFVPRMEFEEFMVLWGVWYAGESLTAGCIGIRCDESLNRFRTIASRSKEMHGTARFTTKISDNLYNAYPIYDWRTEDIWRYHSRDTARPHNQIYDRMHLAGVPISQQRLCQPFGDDQRRGLWLYHLIEPETWFKLVARVNGANSGAMYVGESGNVMGYQKISKPDGHTWESFCRLMLASLPPKTAEHYAKRFRVFIHGWKGRGYNAGIPDEAPKVLEDKHWAPSWRRMCKVLLRNDHWCKGLGLTQPKSAAYERYMQMKGKKCRESVSVSATVVDVESSAEQNSATSTA
jgi:predicted phosphoadenosine phosphosulfate sulfurtransferase